MCSPDQFFDVQVATRERTFVFDLSLLLPLASTVAAASAPQQGLTCPQFSFSFCVFRVSLLPVVEHQRSGRL
jgi:hypothetical protein